MTYIIGFGFVGQAVYSALNGNDRVHIIDPLRGTSTKDKDFQNQIRNSNILGGDGTIIICVGSPSNSNGSCNIGTFSSVWNDIKNFTGLIIIKSTLPKDVIPKEPNVVYNPEFLNANTAKQDFLDQDYVVLGGDVDWTSKAEKWYNTNTTLKESVTYEHCSKDEASDFKYIRNTYNAYKLLFWEFVQDTTGNSRKMSQMMKNIPTSEMDLIGLDGFRGFGGACLPKDVRSFNDVHNHKLTNFMLDYNSDLNDY